MKLLSDGSDPRFIPEEMDDIEFILFGHVEVLEQRYLKMLQKHAEQAADGQWDVNHYQLGIYNGMESLLAIMENRKPNLRQFSAFSAVIPNEDEIETTPEAAFNNRDANIGRDNVSTHDFILPSGDNSQEGSFNIMDELGEEYIGDYEPDDDYCPDDLSGLADETITVDTDFLNSNDTDK